LADNRRQWLTPKSDSLESFAFFLIRLVIAVFAAGAERRARRHQPPASLVPLQWSE
jgi:hypothetical protein